MNHSRTVVILLLAAVLEACGDAIIRVGLHTSFFWHRVGLFSAGAAVLFSYGYVVNAPGWDFGRLLGLYVVFFFVVAQLVSWFGFRQPPSTGVLMGGLLIVAGGLVITFGQQAK